MSKRSRPVGLIALVAVAGLAGAYLSDCIPGLGTGGTGSSTQVPTPERPVKAPDSTPRAPGPATIVVEANRCTLKPATGAKDCSEICADLQSTSTRPVRIEAAQGSHETVEALRICLADAGFSELTVDPGS